MGRGCGAQSERSRLASVAVSLVVGLLCLTLAGCGRSHQVPAPSAPPAPPGRGSASEAVLHEAVSVSREGAATRLSGDGWAFLLPNAADWRRVTDDPSSTLRFTRSVGGVELGLFLRGFAIRSGMPLDTFLAAHRLWMIEAGNRPIDYVEDPNLKERRGYSVERDRETYYAFRVAGDRAYVIEATATGGVLNPAAVGDFNCVVASFRCRPRAVRRKAPG